MLSELLNNGCSVTLSGSSLDDCFHEMVQCLQAKGLVNNTERAVGALLAREEIRTTAIGNGVAIPHAVDAVKADIVMALGYHKDGLDMGAPDAAKVHIFFMLLIKPHSQHLNTLARIAKLIKTTAFTHRVIAEDGPLDNILQEEERRI